MSCWKGERGGARAGPPTRIPPRRMGCGGTGQLACCGMAAFSPSASTAAAASSFGFSPAGLASQPPSGAGGCEPLESLRSRARQPRPRSPKTPPQVAQQRRQVDLGVRPPRARAQRLRAALPGGGRRRQRRGRGQREAAVRAVLPAVRRPPEGDALRWARGAAGRGAVGRRVGGRELAGPEGSRPASRQLAQGCLLNTICNKWVLIAFPRGDWWGVRNEQRRRAPPAPAPVARPRPAPPRAQAAPSTRPAGTWRRQASPGPSGGTARTAGPGRRGRTARRAANARAPAALPRMCGLARSRARGRAIEGPPVPAGCLLCHRAARAKWLL